MCRFSSLFVHFYPVQIDIFSFFSYGGVKQTAKNFTFCWFWLCKNASNWLEQCVFRVWGIPNPVVHSFEVSTISGVLKNQKFQAKISHFVDFDWGKMHWNGLSGVFRVWGILNPMAQLSSLYNKWFLKNQNFRQKFHILLILTGKNASKWLERCIFRVWGLPNPMVQVSRLYDKLLLKIQILEDK